MSPLISVLLPIYNAATTLALTLRSIARQRERRFECVVVDDGSRDDSATIARAFVSKDDRFRLLSRPHSGLVASLNAGITACRGAFVARMDGDDIMHRLRLWLQLRALQATPALAGVGCHVRLFPRANLSAGLRHYERWLNSLHDDTQVARDAFIECPLAHPTLMLRKPLLATYRYRDQGWPEDYDLVLRLLTDGHHLGTVPRRLLFWRDHPSRLSRNDERYAIARFTHCRAHFLARSFLREQPNYVLWGYGGTGKALRKALTAHDKQPSAIVELHPGRLGQRIFGAPVIPPDALAEYRGTPIVVSVAGAPARQLIRNKLASMHFREVTDFVLCA